ncbi:MAG: PQQ-dependent catabolism-associated CXXCW motif protein [Ectothiorhodospiraceae bacterium]|nr:PQQ-dependent catabolism-associated CXXCW motif protein [Paracoccaceae bacterium]MCH8506123.1 PQQ-dependent catabolism-associated CXXCW motif protein [Ectothiorhodospiraceae bacterium]
MQRLRVLPILLPWLITVAAAHQPLDAHMSEDGYRESRFRAELPLHHPDAVTLDTEALDQFVADHAPVLIDVMPKIVLDRPQLDSGLPPGAPRVGLPGAVWLPNIGLPELDHELDTYFRGNLHRLTGGDADRPVVFYCISDCWMAWNAARRASRYGHRAVYWFRDGSDQWSATGREVELLTPVGEGRP